MYISLSQLPIFVISLYYILFYRYLYFSNSIIVHAYVGEGLHTTGYGFAVINNAATCEDH